MFFCVSVSFRRQVRPPSYIFHFGALTVQKKVSFVRRTSNAASAISVAMTLFMCTSTAGAGETPQAASGIVSAGVAARTPRPNLPDVWLKRGETQLFPLGWYDPPADDVDLQKLADAGINLVRCGDRASLDRAAKCGLQGWLSLSVQQGATPELRKQIESVVDHPALAVWEGPDEIVWGFTAYSGLQKTAGISKEDWFEQRPNAKAYAAKQAADILPKMREGIALIRSLDPRKRPFWMDEAVDSDLRYVRGYMNSIDTVGCNYYPVRKGEFDLRAVSAMTDRYRAVGRGKPVWNVLQAFSWHPMVPERGRRYPHFHESRFMAYTSIAHGARGIFYWGSFCIDDQKFRESLYALTSELATIQPFLTSSPMPSVHAEVIRDLFEPEGRGVRAVARKVGDDLLIILVNEDEHRHLAVDVRGLNDWNGRTFHEMYGTDEATVDQGDLAVRMKPFEVRLYCTSRSYETTHRNGREFISPEADK